ncbi:MAG: hypothetical protein ACOCP8_01835, partial [archaeon]
MNFTIHKEDFDVCQKYDYNKLYYIKINNNWYTPLVLSRIIELPKDDFIDIMIDKFNAILIGSYCLYFINRQDIKRAIDWYASRLLIIEMSE